MRPYTHLLGSRVTSVQAVTSDVASRRRARCSRPGEFSRDAMERKPQSDPGYATKWWVNPCAAVAGSVWVGVRVR